MTRERDAFAVRLWQICLVLLFVFPSYGHAESVRVGDIQIDPQDFSPHQDAQTRVAKCLACHGEHAGGDIDFGPGVRFGTPALRGMEHDYLKQALIDYKTGNRPHEEMQVIASMLDEETIDFMARTFAAYPTPPLRTADELARLAAEDLRFRKGQSIVQEGVPETGIPACISCHGTFGEGDPELGPRLAGQNRLYIQRQLTAYAYKTRKTGQAAIMQSVAAGLSGDDIEAIADYYQQLIRVDKP